jgi:hypothetical protein
MLERSGSPARRFDPRGTEAAVFNVSATTRRTLGLALERLAEDPPVALRAELAKLAAAAELAALDQRRDWRALRGWQACPRGWRNTAMRRTRSLRKLHLTADSSSRRLEMLRRSPRTSRKMGREGPAERRVPSTVPWGIQCIDELFGLAQGALAQQGMTQRATASALEGFATLHATYFEEMAAHQEPDLTEADESELSDDDAPATRTDPAPETRVDLE